MRRRIRTGLHNFFFPPPGSRRIVRFLPYIVMGVFSLVVLVAGAYGWEYTNSPEFCGTACHTMPPEYTSYLVSPHARVDCVECHIGRDFIATRITRKAGDIKHIISLAFKQYEFPIKADDLRPARDTCEQCHFPEKFSDDSLREIRTFASDQTNTPSSIYLTLKTGGGTLREGLGRGIHWHIENKVLYLATDSTEQDIPFVRVIQDDGAQIDFVELGFSEGGEEIDIESLQEMDCITCHNRITHLVLKPEDAVDEMLARGLISPLIPEIRLKSLEVLHAQYETKAAGLEGIKGLITYYQKYYAEYYAINNELVTAAIDALLDYYLTSVYPEQKSDWDSHKDNIGHQDSPGCFRCHDGEHLNEQNQAIRLECNVCHSIPVVARPSDFITTIEISRGPEPESHLSPNWIALHRDVFDPSCSNCHSVDNPGGTDDSSFCSNSACHGNVWEYAGFDAPGLRELLQAQLPPVPIISAEAGPLTFNATIGPLFELECGACHGEGGIQSLNLTEYAAAIQGGISGPAITPGDANSSLVIQRQTGDLPHFSQFSPEDL
ncbi:MAG: NapC/NirT family cytochrome c, partial [Anaerolineales bacterium]|nr:NapC/NirT family cytochrome c [Anaerolineales bacterium]